MSIAIGASIISALTPIIGNVLDRLFPDPVEKAKVEAELYRDLIQQQNAISQAAGEIIKAEASSGNWLASSWRPILMLTFGGLIVCRWMGWAAPNLSEAEYIKLWDIVELGIGGYVIGRSAEKALPAVAGTIAAALKK